MKKIEPNLNLIAYEKMKEIGNTSYWRCIQQIKDKIFEGLSEKETELINLHNNLVHLAAENIRTNAIYEGILSKPEIEKWYSDFCLNHVVNKDNIEHIRNMVDIGCPVCKTRLVFVKKMQAETLLEHVQCSEYISKKDVYGCPNGMCEAYEKGLLWLADGEGSYYGYYGDKIDFIDNNSAPFRTFSRKLEAEKEKVIKKIKLFNKIMFELSISCKADEDGKKHWNKIFHLKTCVNKDNCGWIYYQSGIHMFIFSMKMYSKKHLRINNFKNDIRWIKNEKRWWAKLSFEVAKIIWSKDYKEALKG